MMGKIIFSGGGKVEKSNVFYGGVGTLDFKGLRFRLSF
jgi:hypothetical protein